jgi:hypothetical protein
VFLDIVVLEILSLAASALKACRREGGSARRWQG